MDRYVLEIDPDPQLVPTARMFAATVARQLGCAEDAVLDVKIAISEACTSAVHTHRTVNMSEPIRLGVFEDGDDLVYEVVDAAEVFNEVPDEPGEVLDRVLDDVPNEQQMRLALIRALFPTAEVTPAERGSAIRFRVER